MVFSTSSSLARQDQGKTSVAALLPEQLGWASAEADAVHPEANIAKMSSGLPLQDADRWPWLEDTKAWMTAQARAGKSTIVNRLSAGNFGLEGEAGRRVYRALPMLKETANANHWMHPIGGLVAFIDATGREVIRIVDDAIHPIPRENADYRDPAVTGPARTDLKPIEINQPDGPSFSLEEDVLNWHNWRMRLSFNVREGLVLHQIDIDDRGERRPVIYRASIAEMVVPYASTGPIRFWQNYFDVGEYLYGRYTNSLQQGCDCLGDITYRDAVFADESGDPVTIPNAICIHEEDFGVLWKHTDSKSGTTDVRRQRRLVVSMFTTVGNYDYGLYWYFYLDGKMEFEAKLTGLVFASAFPEIPAGFASEIAPGLGAPYHQHLFSARLDTMVDGIDNTVSEVRAQRLPVSDTNPWGNGFTQERIILASEQSAIRDGDEENHVAWRVSSGTRQNRLGEATEYELLPKGQARLLADPSSSIAQRAAFATHNLWVTAYDPAEAFPAGDFVNQHPGGAGLPSYVQADRNLVGQDVVLWHTFGLTHFPRLEDYPIMPVDYAGFTLRPSGFFDRNPSLDVAASTPVHAACHSDCK
jgi:primary-amine oxidase